MVDQQQIQQWIIELRSSKYTVQREAANNLAEFGDETVIRPLILGREFDSEEFGGRFDRTVPVEMIAQRLGAAAVKPLIDTLLEADEKQKRFPIYAVEAGLIIIGNDAVEPVAELLRHPSEFVRTCAIAILERIGDSRAILPLVEVVKIHPSSEAVKALSQLGAEGIEALLELWKSENQSVRFWIVRLISLHDSPDHLERIRDMLIDALQDAYWLVKINAIKALGRFGNEQIVELLIPFLSDQAYQHPAAKALEKIGTPEALQAVRDWQILKNL
jgi:HEAT repeat protein